MNQSRIPTLTQEIDDFRLTLSGDIPVMSAQDFCDTAPPAPTQVELILKATSIATIQMGDGTTKLVLFRPTAATRQAVKHYEGWDIALVIEDVNGIFTPRSPQRIIDNVYEAGNNTMIVTTENQNA